MRGLSVRVAYYGFAIVHTKAPGRHMLQRDPKPSKSLDIRRV